jgi:ankyrin
MSANISAPELLQSDLLKAVCAGNNQEVNRLIGLRADITAKDDAGCGLLQWAATYGHLHTLKMLQQKGLDIEGTANDRSTPLHSAAWSGQLEIVAYLLSKGLNANLKTNNGETPLHFAAWGGHVEVIKELIRRGAKVDATNDNGKTPLDLASEHKHDAASEYLALALQRIADLKAAVLRLDNNEIDRLVKEGAYIGTKDSNGSTLLHWAASAAGDPQQQVETMRHLVTRHNMDIFAMDDDGSTLLHTAAVNGKSIVMTYLLEQGIDVNSIDANGYTPLHLAAWMGHIDSVQFLVEHEANISMKAQDGRTAHELAMEHDTVRDYLAVVQLKWLNAVRTGNIDEINDLIAQDVTIPSTALHYAVRYNQVVLMDYLLSALKIDVNCKNELSETPLHLAAACGRKEAVECLLRHEAKIDALDKLKRPPLHWAFLSKNVGTITALLDAGANVKVKNTNGETALHIAACHGFQSAVERCLEQDIANINNTDEAGYNPLHWAALNGHKEIVDILLKNGADPNIKDNMGRTYKDLMQISSSQKQEMQSLSSSSSNPLHTMGHFASSKSEPEEKERSEQTSNRSSSPLSFKKE